MAAILTAPAAWAALSDPGHVMWSYRDGRDVAIDVLSAAGWPTTRPSTGCASRRVQQAGDSRSHRPRTSSSWWPPRRWGPAAGKGAAPRPAAARGARHA